MEGLAIEVRGIAKAYGDTRALAGVDLDVPRGTITAILGPNGAGKTTLISILATLVRPDAGMARVAGHDVVADPKAVRRAISLTGQQAAVDATLTGRENLQLVGRLLGLGLRGASARADQLLAHFDLSAAGRKRAKTYSGGMRRRLDLAMGLVTSPEVIFLDEPTTGLDTRSRRELWSMIVDLAARGATILLTTQYLEEADELADEVIVIDHGKVVGRGAPAELKSAVGGDIVEIRDHADTVVRECPTDGTLAGLDAALARLRAEEAPGTRVTVRSPSLDDVFLALTRSRSDAAASSVAEASGDSLATTAPEAAKGAGFSAGSDLGSETVQAESSPRLDNRPGRAAPSDANAPREAHVVTIRPHR